MRTPLFPGDSEIDEIFKIFQKLGTPTEENWPGVTQLPDFKTSFPQWRPRNLKEIIKTLDDDGIELLTKCLVYEPALRISAKRALQLPYFQN